MMTINSILELVGSDASRNHKIATLTTHATNATLRQVVFLAYDPFTQFYIRKIPAYTTKPKIDFMTLPEAMSQLFTLSSRLLTGNAGIEHLKFLLENTSADDAKVLEKIIQKDLRAGFSGSTANKIWSGLIKEYPVMLCSPFEQRLVDKIKFPAYVQLKMDGMRFNAIVREGKCEFRSRNGKEIQLLGNLEQEFIEMAGDVDCVFDGELLVEIDGKLADRQTGNGILNKANKGTISAADAASVRATVWDIIPYIMFESGYCATPYSHRLVTLNGKVFNKKKIRVVESVGVEDIEAARVIFERYLEQGQEGIILKDTTGVWEDKRSKSQIKFKGEEECDLRIVGIEGGTGKYEGMLGAIICESADGVVKTRVGSGFNDEHRKTLGEEIIDKIVAIKYNMRSIDKQGKHSLFLPIFIEIREDKTVADSSEVIK